MLDSMTVMDTIRRNAILPVLVLDIPEAAFPLSQALLAGGLNCAEVTLRSPNAQRCIHEMAQNPDFIVGAGTVLTPDQVDQAVEAGASFIVSPGFNAAVVERAQGHGMAVVPGVATATEIQLALDAGLDTLKFFPAEQLGGPGMLRALAAPFPHVRFIPTGGISVTSMPGYLAIPAVLAVGGSWLVSPDLIESRDWSEITRLTRDAHLLTHRDGATKLALERAAAS
jgi:2-dehydro-3-deoxyphosphogluconate aldolase/(4S)-4-hydroxy-2-oxoglutarate aldolase